MKKKLFIILIHLALANSLIAQINQQDSTLAAYLKSNFPYNSVVSNNCDSQFVGCFYVSLKIGKEGKCSYITFSGIRDSMIINAVQSVLLSPQLQFASSLQQQFIERTIVQPVLYSYYNCTGSLLDNDDEQKMADKCYLYIKTLQEVGRRVELMNKSISQGFTLNEESGFYDGIMLKPCIIDFSPMQLKLYSKNGLLGSDLRRKQYTKEEIDRIEQKVKEMKKEKRGN